MGGKKWGGGGWVRMSRTRPRPPVRHHPLPQPCPCPMPPPCPVPAPWALCLPWTPLLRRGVRRTGRRRVQPKPSPRAASAASQFLPGRGVRRLWGVGNASTPTRRTSRRWLPPEPPTHRLHSVTPQPAGGCTDTPRDANTCQQQLGWGTCGREWMKGYCDKRWAEGGGGVRACGGLAGRAVGGGPPQARGAHPAPTPQNPSAVAVARAPARAATPPPRRTHPAASWRTGGSATPPTTRGWPVTARHGLKGFLRVAGMVA